MKRRLSALLVVCCALILCTFTSCYREYVCKCKLEYSGAPGLNEGEVREYTITDSKKNAENKCKASSKVYDIDGIHTEENCELF